MMLEGEFRTKFNFTTQILKSMSRFLPTEDIIDLGYVFRFTRTRFNQIIEQKLCEEFKSTYGIENLEIPEILKHRQIYRILVGQEKFRGKYGGAFVFVRQNEKIRFTGVCGYYQITCDIGIIADSILNLISNPKKCLSSRHRVEICFSENCIESVLKSILSQGFRFSRGYNVRF